MDSQKRGLPGRLRAWLERETDEWVLDGIIDPAQAEKIRGRYAPPESGISWAIVILGGIGAILLGLGIILFFAFNWDQMGKFAKLAVIFGFLAASHAAGMSLQRRSPKLADSFHLLGTMLFGAGIWLVAQVYHIEEHYPNGVMWWALGSIAMCAALGSAAQGFLASALLMVWAGMEAVNFRESVHVAPAAALALAAYGYRLRSTVLWLSGVISSAVTVMFVANGSIHFGMAPVNYMGIGFIVYCMGLSQTSRAFDSGAGVLQLIGQAGYFLLLYILTFRQSVDDLIDKHRIDSLGGVYCALIGLLAAVIFADVVRSSAARERRDSAWMAAVFVIFSALTWCSAGIISRYNTHLLAGLFTLIFIAHGVYFVVSGCRNLSGRRVFSGCLLIGLIILARYFDLFDSLLARSLAFVIAGASFFAVGVYYNRLSRGREIES